MLRIGGTPTVAEQQDLASAEYRGLDYLDGLGQRSRDNDFHCIQRKAMLTKLVADEARKIESTGVSAASFLRLDHD
jgi:hypothetical protein